MANSNGNKPEKTFRLGNISASVFVTTTQNGNGTSTFRTVTAQRSYRDGNVTKYDPSFSARDLPSLFRVLQLAQQHVEQFDVLHEPTQTSGQHASPPVQPAGV